MMKLGFTGTRKGMSPIQILKFKTMIDALSDRDEIEFHHGDCVGADAEAHKIAHEYGCKIVIHPPADDSYRAWCKEGKILAPKKYIDRNHDIVDSVSLMIGAPETDEPPAVLRGAGTWSTIHYAHRCRVHVRILFR
jgi:hypothetical protein